MTFLNVSTEMSLSSFVMPVNDSTTLLFAKMHRGMIASKYQPIDLLLPQSCSTLPPTTTPGRYLSAVPVSLMRICASESHRISCFFSCTQKRKRTKD